MLLLEIFNIALFFNFYILFLSKILQNDRIKSQWFEIRSDR